MAEIRVFCHYKRFIQCDIPRILGCSIIHALKMYASLKTNKIVATRTYFRPQHNMIRCHGHAMPMPCHLSCIQLHDRGLDLLHSCSTNTKKAQTKVHTVHCTVMSRQLFSFSPKFRVTQPAKLISNLNLTVTKIQHGYDRPCQAVVRAKQRARFDQGSPDCRQCAQTR